MRAAGGVGGLSRWIAAVMIGLVWMGCDRDGEEPGVHQGPYSVVDIHLEQAEGADGWAPGDERVHRWFQEVLEESKRGMANGGEGFPVEARLRHGVRIDELDGATQLIVELDVAITEVGAAGGAPVLSMSTEAEFFHPLSEDHPDDDVLQAVSATLGRQAVEETVDQLRNLAEIKQGESWELVRWSRTSGFGKERRLLAIQELAHRDVEGAEATLKRATESESPKVAVEAALAMYKLDRDQAAHPLMDVAQRMSRDEEYEHYLRLLPVVGKLDEPWVSIYLETVAQAHTDYRVRQKARSLSAERPPIE